MGWDAYAVRPDGHTVYSPRSVDKVFKAKFKTAARAAGKRLMMRLANYDGDKFKTYGLDAMLKDGALGCSECGRALGYALDIDAWGDDLSHFQLCVLNTNAVWNYSDPARWWAVESARAFIETCVKTGCGVTFSY